MIELTAADRNTFTAYRAEPAAEPKGAVVVLQEVFGVNRHIRKIVDDFAAQGYLAIAPALFDRARQGAGSGVGVDRDEIDLAGGIEMIRQAGEAGPFADIQATVDAVRSVGKVAVVGYCWGGYLSYLAANRVDGLACSIGYYGGGIPRAGREKRKIPTLLHFGLEDHLVPYDGVIQFRATRPDVTVYSYPAGHGFNFEERDSYNEESARRAWDRTLFMISQYVEGQAPIQLTHAGAYLSQETKKKKKPVAADGPPE